MAGTDDNGMILDDRVFGRPAYSPVCSLCKHLVAGNAAAGTAARCAAFDVIPDEIWNGQYDHRAPYAGDRGVRFEQRPG